MCSWVSHHSPKCPVTRGLVIPGECWGPVRYRCFAPVSAFGWCGHVRQARHQRSSARPGICTSSAAVERWSPWREGDVHESHGAVRRAQTRTNIAHVVAPPLEKYRAFSDGLHVLDTDSPACLVPSCAFGLADPERQGRVTPARWVGATVRWPVRGRTFGPIL